MADYNLSLRRMEQLLGRGANSNNQELRDCADEVLFWLCRCGSFPLWEHFPLAAAYLGQRPARSMVTA